MNKAVKITLCLLYFLLSIYLSVFVARTDFFVTIGLFSTLFILIYTLKNIRFIWLLILGFGTRFALCFVLPELSDDYFRFVWDGVLNLKGINPYYYKPSELVNELPALQHIYDNLNSKEYYSVYPSVNQFIYTIGVFIGRGNLYWSTVVMKTLIFLAEGISIFSLLSLCKYFKVNRKIALLYILNPLVIIEFCGNLHFEGFMLSALLFTLYLLSQNKQLLASTSFAFAICLKIMPLMLLPFFFKYLGLRKGFLFSLLTITLSVVSFIPFHIWEHNVYGHILESINLYFTSFEFNSSVFRVMQYFHLNEHIYFKFLPKAILIMTIGYYFIKSKKHNFNDLVISLVIVQIIYLFFSQSIHPWYILPILPLALLVKRLDLFLWSYLILFTYITYRTNQYNQSILIISIEYLVLLGFIVADYILGLSNRLLKDFGLTCIEITPLFNTP